MRTQYLQSPGAERGQGQLAIAVIRGSRQRCQQWCVFRLSDDLREHILLGDPREQTSWGKIILVHLLELTSDLDSGDGVGACAGSD